MGKKCCAPNCRSGYKEENMIDISMHKFRGRWKEKFPRGGDWKVTKNTIICSKHFTDNDFVMISLDKTTSRARKGTSLLKHRYLKKDASPSIFPNCPQYLSKKTPVRHSLNYFIIIFFSKKPSTNFLFSFYQKL